MTTGFSFLFFFTSSMVYLILMMVYAYLWKIYLYGYYYKKPSQIIHSLSWLFFWHSIQMGTLMFMAILTYYGQHNAKYPFYIIAAVSGFAEVKYSLEFSFWSVTNEPLSIDKKP